MSRAGRSRRTTYGRAGSAWGSACVAGALRCMDRVRRSSSRSQSRHPRASAAVLPCRPGRRALAFSARIALRSPHSTQPVRHSCLLSWPGQPQLSERLHRVRGRASMTSPFHASGCSGGDCMRASATRSPGLVTAGRLRFVVVRQRGPQALPSRGTSRNADRESIGGPWYWIRARRGDECPRLLR